MKAYIQAIQKSFLQSEYIKEKATFWYAQIPNLSITEEQIKFSFAWREWEYHIITKSSDDYYYSGKVECKDYDDEIIDFNYYKNNNHHLLIGNWNEENISYQIIIEATGY